MKKRTMMMLAVIVIAAILGGCAAGVMSPAVGMLYTNTKGAIGAGSGTAATKSGEACATSILVIATGDASIEAAMAKGGIKNIAYVDYTAMSILGVYGKNCTIVKGN